MLSVGEVIYLLDKRTHAIIPCMVVEKVSSVSLEGENTHHMIASPNGKKIKLENYKSPWFPNIEEARSFLIDTSMSLIEKVISDALQVASKSFEITEAISPEINSSLEEAYESNKKIEDGLENFANNAIVDLGNGQTAKVTLSSEGV